MFWCHVFPFLCSIKNKVNKFWTQHGYLNDDNGSIRFLLRVYKTPNDDSLYHNPHFKHRPADDVLLTVKRTIPIYKLEQLILEKASWVEGFENYKFDLPDFKIVNYRSHFDGRIYQHYFETCVGSYLFQAHKFGLSLDDIKDIFLYVPHIVKTSRWLCRISDFAIKLFDRQIIHVYFWARKFLPQLNFVSDNFSLHNVTRSTLCDTRTFACALFCCVARTGYVVRIVV